jgi:cytochrome P450
MSLGFPRQPSTLENIGAVGATGIWDISPAQVITLIAAMVRGLLWSRRAASRELRAWRNRAAVIPNVSIRRDALDAIVGKQDNIEGASLFSILPKHRDECLLRLLVAYQILWDFLDSISERGAYAGYANGYQLHRALVEALDPEASMSDYYRYHPWKDDGGYLLALVETCRQMCAGLSCYRHVRLLMLQAVERSSIQSLNHEPDARRRDGALKRWAERDFVGEHALEWFELTAAASAFTPHILLALAAESSLDQRELADVYSTYFPWVGLAIAMLDSYIDQPEDGDSKNHSYISHYANETVALNRLATIIRRIVIQTARLPKGHRHAVLAEGIIAWHLSVDSVNTPTMRAKTRMLARAGGPLTRLLMPMASMWRATSTYTSGARDNVSNLPQDLRLPSAVQTYVIWRFPFRYLEWRETRYGKRMTQRQPSFPPLVLLSDPSEVKAMLTAPADVLHPGEGGVMIAPIVDHNSFMLLDEREHLNGRHAVLPALRKSIIDKEDSWVTDTMRRAIARWPREVGFPLHPHLRALTLTVILRRIFAGDEFRREDRHATLREAALAMLEVTGSVVFPLPILRHGPGRVIWRSFLRHRSKVDTLIHILIDERMQSGPADHGALGALLAARDGDGTPMSRTQLRDNVMSLILAGHETTASQLAWAFQLLAHNPRVQRRLIEEIDEDAGETYLTATIQEVLRHRPVFLFTIPRAVMQPIEIGGWTYRPPAHLLGCIYLLHHDPGVYPEPEEFRPERFLEGQPSPYTYLPWGGGRRRCPGSHLALLEMKAVLRTVLETMTIDPASRRMERPRWRSVIVTPHAGSRVVLRPRERRPLQRGAPGVGRAAASACPASGHTADLAEL